MEYCERNVSAHRHVHNLAVYASMYVLLRCAHEAQIALRARMLAPFFMLVHALSRGAFGFPCADDSGEARTASVAVEPAAKYVTAGYNLIAVVVLSGLL